VQLLKHVQQDAEYKDAGIYPPQLVILNLFQNLFTALSRSMLLYKGLQYLGDCFILTPLRAFRVRTALVGMVIPYTSAGFQPVLSYTRLPAGPR